MLCKLIKLRQNNGEQVGAILHAGQPSAQCLGIGDVIFGKKVPAGRTIQVFYVLTVHGPHGFPV